MEKNTIKIKFFKKRKKKTSNKLLFCPAPLGRDYRDRRNFRGSGQFL